LHVEYHIRDIPTVARHAIGGEGPKLFEQRLATFLEVIVSPLPVMEVETFPQERGNSPAPG
jgi:hypothetical protein